METRPVLWASDSDRERIAEQLRRASAEGRLFADELEDRLGAVFSARTYGELDRLVADLPPDVAPSRGRSRALIPARTVVPVAIVLAALLAALAAAARQSSFQASGHVGRGGAGPFTHQGPHLGPQLFMAGSAIAGLLVILALCAALGWVVVQKPPAHGKSLFPGHIPGRGRGPAAR
jgi:hypothetical protein